ncbi:MAG: hypothetical protein IKE55_08685 [Kiritimatiellae bacterium]|nr:hypothetical protein [Kiritimatiellia bacterium]
MISAVSEQFSKFVQFAEDQSARGKEKAIATKGDVAVGGGTTLEERSIVRTDKIDWVGLVIFRSDDAKRANNEVRALFKKTVAEMFGGEQNIPHSVKEAMLMKDYGCGKPLTARRIIAVRDAIADLGRVNCFDKANDPDGQLAKKAIANGYTRLDFGRLNTAANLLVEAKRGSEGELSYGDALEQVITKGSAANLTMNVGSLYMKNATVFFNGLGHHERIAGDDARNIELAKSNTSEESVANFAEIANNLEHKFRNLLYDVEDLLVAANLPHETLDRLRTAVDAVADKFKDVSTGIASGEIKSREEVYKRLFNVMLTEINNASQNLFNQLSDAAAQSPAIEEFRQYLPTYFKDVGESYLALCETYKLAVARDMVKEAEGKLLAAAADGGLATGTQVSIPKAVIDDLYGYLAVNPFLGMKNLEKFCGHLETYGDANLRFSDAQKAELKELVEKAFGSGPKADKILNRLIERFETTFFAEQLHGPTNFGKTPPKRPELVLNHFKEHPEALIAFDPGFKLDTEEEADAVKRVIKEIMLADIKAKLNEPDTSKMTSLSSGLMPQAVREYHSGYVTFNGMLIPNAEFGTNFPQLRGEADTPAQKGYAEFLEKKFDASHKKMRQTVSYICGMANGLGGMIESMVDEKGKENYIKGVSREEIREKGTTIITGDLRPDENYDITFGDNRDVKITFTHFFESKALAIGGYVPQLPVAGTAPVLGTTKVVVTMTVKNVADADLGPNEMPEFTIDDIQQEELYNA